MFLHASLRLLSNSSNSKIRPALRDAPATGHPRSIPTCVGLTRPAASRISGRAVHPHVRGAHQQFQGSLVVPVGPSPRAWGSPSRRGRCRSRGRSIPTCVGLTLRRLSISGLAMVHPHVRGAHDAANGFAHLFSGPSPRAWGSPDRRPHESAVGRSIPTCVGLTVGHGAALVAGDGPSPRAWGSRGGCEDGVLVLRSIPTCVGLTNWRPTSGCVRTVHPHVRGAHKLTRGLVCLDHGPSPRAWGSQLLTCNFARRYLLVTTLPGSAASLVPHLPTPIVEQVEARRSPQSHDDAPPLCER